jgi:hypothetical protein
VQFTDAADGLRAAIAVVVAVSRVAIAAALARADLSAGERLVAA